MVLAHNTRVQRTEDVKINTETTFQTMMLSKPILDGLTSAGFYEPSPIQLLGIPLGKLGLDLILEAKSGTGKTVVFTTIALEKLNHNEGLQVLIVTPTREIAAQICDVLKQIGSHIQGLNVEMIIGGLSLKEDLEKLKNNVQILVGTPGRLVHLIKDKHIRTSKIHLLILDEADKLLESNFETDILYIHTALPKVKQVILSSATYPDTFDKAVKEIVPNPHHVCPDKSKILLGISHRVTSVKYNSNSVRQTEIRFFELTKLLSEIEFKQCIIFCNYQARVMQLHKLLTKAKWPAELIYGKQQQQIRLEALKTLQEYRCRILISTDLLSRGIDLKNVDLVINFEPPYTCETYLHRIGRSGRYGSIGMAVSIVCEGTELNSFNQTLEPIMQAMKMKQFWTGDELNNIGKSNEQDRDQMSITTEESKLNTLSDSDSIDSNETTWKSLSYIKKVENFDQVCSSHNTTNSKVKIESFSDLVEDFAKVNSECDGSTYRMMGFENITFNNSFEYIDNLKDCNRNIKDINTLKDEECIQKKSGTTKIYSFSELLEDFAKMKSLLPNNCESSTRVMKFENVNYENSFDSIGKLKECNNKIKDVNTLKDEDYTPQKKTAKIESFSELLEDFAKMKRGLPNHCESSTRMEFENMDCKNSFDSIGNYIPQKSTSKIESFSELLEDFAKMKNVLPNNFESSTRMVKFENMDCKNSFDSIGKLKECSSNIKDVNTLKDVLDYIPHKRTTKIESFSELLEDFAKMKSGLPNHCESSTRTMEFENMDSKNSFDSIGNYIPQKSTSKIESFSELLEDFAKMKSGLPHHCESSTRTMEFENMDSKNSFDSIGNYIPQKSTSKIESFSELLEDFANVLILLPNECESSTYKTIEFDNLLSQNSVNSIKKLKECIKDEECVPEQSVRNHNSSNNSEPNLSKLVNENVDIPENYFLNELPKAFSTKKFNKGNKKQTKKNQNTKYLNKCVNTYTTKENIQSTTDYPKTNHKFSSTANTYSEEEYHNSEYQKKEQEYNKWYRQLKTRMNQIEQMLYIEEMTK